MLYLEALAGQDENEIDTDGCSAEKTTYIDDETEIATYSATPNKDSSKQKLKEARPNYD